MEGKIQEGTFPAPRRKTCETACRWDPYRNEMVHFTALCLVDGDGERELRPSRYAWHGVAPLANSVHHTRCSDRSQQERSPKGGIHTSPTQSRRRLPLPTNEALQSGRGIPSLSTPETGFMPSLKRGFAVHVNRTAGRVHVRGAGSCPSSPTAGAGGKEPTVSRGASRPPNTVSPSLRGEGSEARSDPGRAGLGGAGRAGARSRLPTRRRRRAAHTTSAPSEASARRAVRHLRLAHGAGR